MGRLRSRLLTSCVVMLATLVAAVVVEVVLRQAPGLIPLWYRQTLPAGGVELVTPGVLGRTPISGVPVPYGSVHRRMITGDTPRGLERLGLVAPAENPDPADVPSLRYRLDRFGFLNPREIDRADILLVGDSFVVGTGILDPPGLQSKLAEATRLEVFNLAVPSIGPVREAWLLDEVGLNLEPRLVIWFFFGGNDLQDAARVDSLRRAGVSTYADLFGDATMPRSVLFGLVGASVGRIVSPAPDRPDPLPGFRLTTAAGDVRIWFHPAYLRQLTQSRRSIESSAGWTTASAAMAGAFDALDRRGIPLLVVFVPSKPQVYLPFIDRDVGLVFQAASVGGTITVTTDEFLRSALAHSGDLETVVAEFCRSRGIDFVSLTPQLTELARRGELGYFAADPHWNQLGQHAALPALIDWIERTLEVETVDE